MFRIHRIFDATTPAGRQLVAQVQAILRVQFAAVSEKDIAQLPARLANPLKYRFRSILLVAEDGAATVRGFALLLHAPDLGFCYLDYISAGRAETGGGIGGALYQRVREQALQLDVAASFARITEAARHAREVARLPVFVGGDHSISFPLLRAFDDEEALHVVQFDAHLDFSDARNGTKLSNSSPFRRAFEALPGLSGRTVIGLRGMRADEELEIVRYLQRHAQRGFDPAADPAVARALERGAGRLFADACSQCHVLPDPSQR